MLALLLSLGLGLPPSSPAPGQPPPEAAQQTADEPELRDGELELQEARGRLQALDAELDPGQRATDERYLAWKAVEERWLEAERWRRAAADFERAGAEAAENLRAIRAELARPPQSMPDAPAGADEPQLEQRLAEDQAKLAAARAQLQEIEREASERSERRRRVPDELARARSTLDAAEEELAGGAATAGEADRARRALHEATRAAALAELGALQAELASYDARSDLLPARRERAQRRVVEAEARVGRWQELLDRERRRDAELMWDEARSLLAALDESVPPLESLAEENVRMAERRRGPEGLPARLDEVARELSTARRDLAALENRVRTTRRKVRAAGMTEAIGLLLRKQYEDLPVATVLASQAKGWQREAANAQYELILLEEDAASTAERESEIARQVAPADAAAALVGPILEQRRELLRVLTSETAGLFDQLVDLDVNVRLQARLADAYATYIEERILGVRSSAGGLLPDLSGLRRELAWLLDPTAWLRAWAEVGREIGGHAGGLVLWLLIVGAVLALQGLARKEIREAAARVGDYTQDRFTHTLRALVGTLFLSLPLPAMLHALAWLLGLPPKQEPVALAVAAGLRITVPWIWVTAFGRHLLRANGLGRRHFRWPEGSVQYVRRALGWLDTIAVPAILLFATMARAPRELRSDSLARIALWVGLIALASFCRRVLRPAGPGLQPYLHRVSGGVIDRLRMVWYPLSVAAPVLLVGFSMAGYQYTAQQITLRLMQTGGFIALLVLVNALLARWLFVAKRRVLLEQAAARREARGAEEKREGGEAADLGLAEDEVFNFSAMGEKTRKLFAGLTMIATLFGLWQIWEDVLPAVRLFDRVQVWPSWRLVELQDEWELRVEPMAKEAGGVLAAGSSYSTPSSPLPGVVPETAGDGRDARAGEQPLDLAEHVVRLSDVFTALFILLITWIAARDVPALIEIVLVQFFDLDAGARYAAGTIARYVVSLIGATLFLRAFQIGWESVQWLAAALTFGLAFGLQEIFANFVSGVILLIERPMRIGDMVTVGDIEGYVSKIRFRATTILDWDRRELIVPNKDFITGRLINWTLTDPITRVTIPVGVAYGSDTRLARELLLRAAGQCTHAMTEPKPRALFLRFGESTLDFELRVFIPSRDVWPDLVHEIHTLIDDQFRAHGVEIAFPQRDLHIRSGLEALRPDAGEQA